MKKISATFRMIAIFNICITPFFIAMRAGFVCYSISIWIDCFEPYLVYLGPMSYLWEAIWKKMEPEGETIRLKLYIFGLQFIDLNISRLIIMAKTQPESSRYQSKSVYLSKSKL